MAGRALHALRAGVQMIIAALVLIAFLLAEVTMPATTDRGELMFPEDDEK